MTEVSASSRRQQSPRPRGPNARGCHCRDVLAAELPDDGLGLAPLVIEAHQCETDLQLGCIQLAMLDGPVEHALNLRHRIRLCKLSRQLPSGERLSHSIDGATLLVNDRVDEATPVLQPIDSAALRDQPRMKVDPGIGARIAQRQELPDGMGHVFEPRARTRQVPIDERHRQVGTGLGGLIDGVEVSQVAVTDDLVAAGESCSRGQVVELTDKAKDPAAPRPTVDAARLRSRPAPGNVAWDEGVGASPVPLNAEPSGGEVSTDSFQELKQPRNELGIFRRTFEHYVSPT